MRTINDLNVRTATPTVNDDRSAGFSANQSILVVNDGANVRVYLCTSDAVGAAVWTQIASASSQSLARLAFINAVSVNPVQDGGSGDWNADLLFAISPTPLGSTKALRFAGCVYLRNIAGANVNTTLQLLIVTNGGAVTLIVAIDPVALLIDGQYYTVTFDFVILDIGGSYYIANHITGVSRSASQAPTVTPVIEQSELIGAIGLDPTTFTLRLKSPWPTTGNYGSVTFRNLSVDALTV